jgi:hypothetical protein
MGSKHQHEQWLRQQRLQVYVEFVRTAESLTVDYFGGFEELLEMKDDLERRVRLLGELSAGIDLLGPDEVAAYASKIDEWLVDGLNFEVKAEHLGRTLPVGDVAIEAQEMLPKFRRLAAHHVRATK